MLELSGVCYSYDQTFKLNAISFKVKKGEVLGIIGESGCGKTTLLKLIFGELEPEAGEIRWNGEKVPGPSDQLILGHKDFKYVTQDFELMPFISVLENIIKPLSRQFMSENIQRAKDLLKVVDLEEFENRKVKDLSGGQKQRVALAQALAKSPRLILLDEPFSHIDNFLKNKLRRNLFDFFKKEMITCIVVTHDIADVLPFSSNIAVLKDGSLISHESPQNMYAAPGTSYIAGLFGDFNHLNSSLIPNLDSDKASVIVYPQDIKLVENPDGNAKILDQYFYGAFFHVKAEWQNKEVFVHSKTELNKKSRYKLEFNSDKIKTRNK